MLPVVVLGCRSPGTLDVELADAGTNSWTLAPLKEEPPLLYFLAAPSPMGPMCMEAKFLERSAAAPLLPPPPMTGGGPRLFM